MSSNPWTRKWDDRYAGAEFAYGREPNVFFKAQLQELAPGRILFPAEGEGRNAVHAAELGWEVFAFDISIEGKKKALRLAEIKNVTIDYRVGELPDLGYEEGRFDAIASIYAHFPPTLRSEYHRLLDRYLREGGTLIFEGFSKAHLQYNSKNPDVGGPKEADALFSIEELRADFPDLEFIVLKEEEVELNEGLYHNGVGSVIRAVGRKESNSDPKPQN